ncbi:response regulator transcription factor [Pseudomonas sp. CCI3.2]|uniref:response regulator transcription factor n=1 Tax=unclassified Pseudomonas TaxID=196821 RepID=UPI002AC8C8A3|nr:MULTISPECIES: response regulator transcription factor [unclassified Pseudomonas]MEB0079666.1 response regulator transcription factor [Pseudomonas sp. MH10out]MEB0093393.1 response regulator transcription factor [Pseudomonas sp. CCI4.2]MEB0102290.1 response regulator transcription factor [Pseudomonas sp. CCI3.2]MEB0129422.1 response regulator transcription factor [Pseudomonas sp. CCI2.4]MEB0160587.1 response regulator transcription factor [Pseudomonas sp. AH2 (2023)]
MTPARPIRIALVDDHALVRDGVRALLAVRPSFDVVGEAEDGPEAINLCSQVSPDILLIDIGLKDMNGLELTRLLRAQYPTIKILILSMYDNQEYIATSIRAGASGYVLKNAPSREIVAAIEAIAAGGTFYSAEVALKLASKKSDETELTPRESQVLVGLAQGLDNKTIARELAISVRTVETHRLSIRRKLNVDKPAGLVKYAMEHGLLSR